MLKPNLTFVLPLLCAVTLSAPTYAEVAGIKDGAQMTREVASQVRDISTPELRREIERNPDLVLIDIRMPDEIRNMGGAIKATQDVNIPRGWLEFRATRYAQHKDAPIVVYCGGNIRSILAAHTLQQMGYTNVRNYADGFIGWKKHGLPVE
ncbi:MAG: rhodanese-like domain-containing protein [Thiobacillus sp.]|nr:rhodanese-like domain-containing protein [Thiobacillus sp.]